MNHSFDIEIARTYSVDIAIFLNNIAFWLIKNIANRKHFHDGTYWTYNTQNAFLEIFPYWSRQSLRRIINSCIEKELMIEGNYNDFKYDQTKWYALTSKGLELFKIEIPEEPAPSLIGWNQPMAPSLIGWNQPMEWLESTNGMVGINQPIPDTTTDTKTDITTTTTKQHEEVVISENIKLHAGFNLDNPPPNLVVPTTKNGGTPPPNLVVISKISKKKVKKDITPLPPETKKQELAVIDPSYEYPETLYQSNKSTELVTIPFTDNPHNLPMEIIHEWVKYRKGKKWPLSQIVWTRLNKELAKCQNPQDAFEQVVAAGWQGFTAEWITKNEPKRSFFDYDKNSLVDDKDIF